MKHQITLSQQHLQVINDALMQMPYFLAAPVIRSINDQLSTDKPENHGDDNPVKISDPMKSSCDDETRTTPHKGA